MSMKNIGAAVSLFFFCAAPSWAQALIVSQVVDGGVWQTTIVLTNTTAATANANLNFFLETTGNATQPWNLPFLEVASTQLIALAPAETLLLHTPGTAAAASQGWGQIVADPGVVAYAIFTERSPGSSVQVGTSPAQASVGSILAPFDNTSGNIAAMALANTSSAPGTIVAAFRTTGGTITQTTLNIPPQGHIAFLLPQQFAATAGQSGLAEFYTTSGPFSMLALSFTADLSLSTAPVYVESGPAIIATGVTTVTAYCGFFTGTPTGVFNLLVTAAGSVNGIATRTGGTGGVSSVALTGQVTGTSVILTANTGFVLTGTIQNGTVTATSSDGGGTLTGSTSACH